LERDHKDLGLSLIVVLMTKQRNGKKGLLGLHYGNLERLPCSLRVLVWELPAVAPRALRGVLEALRFPLHHSYLQS
jgi:hypothetical protein